MILVVVSLLDKKARVFKNPFFVPNTEVAIRSLRLAVNSLEKSDLTNFPEDFAMYQLGTFDDDTGLFTGHSAPIHIAEAMQLKATHITDTQRN